MSDQVPKAEARLAGREVQVPQDATLTAEEGCRSSETMGIAAAAALCRGLCAAVPLAYLKSGDFQILIKSVLIAKTIILL